LTFTIAFTKYVITIAAPDWIQKLKKNSTKLHAILNKKHARLLEPT